MHLRYFYLETVAIVQCPGGVCVAVHIRRCRGHAVWTSVSATCCLLLTVLHLHTSCGCPQGLYDASFIVFIVNIIANCLTILS